MARLEDLTDESFLPHLNSIFKVKLTDGEFQDLELIEIARSKGASDKHICFSLIFKHESNGCLLQRTYELCHAEMSEFPLFLTPVGSYEKGFFYQAIFNRFQPSPN